MAGRNMPLAPSTPTILLVLLFLSAFLGERTCGDLVSTGSLKGRKDGRGSNVQVDVAATVVAADGSDRVLSDHVHGVRFEPASLDFQEQSIGMPKMDSILVHNPSSSQSLHLNSISGDSPVFHAAFFKSKVLKAGESTTFDVIFLPRAAETVQTTLYIQTSLGTFDYKVQGIGVPNQFRLRSLLGARIPLNATYSPLISMYNPYNASLQITEMYSSGGELHLELLTGQPHGTKSLWEIRPFETKTIGRANFFGRQATNHTSFIRIKTNHMSSPSIVLPVEVEVLETASLFLSREILDFSILKSGESKSLPLFVLNTSPHQVHIKSITIVPENRAIEVEYTSIILKPGSKYTKIAMITYHSDRVSAMKQTSGVLIVRADGRTAYQLEVPFEANVLHGYLSYEKSKTLFKVGRPPFHPVVHQIPLANRFKVPVVIYDAKLPSKAQEYFTLQSFKGPFVLPPDSEWYYPFSIQFLPSSSDCLFNTTIRLATNSTYFTIPLHCYDGRVKYSVEGSADEEDTLDYGVLSESDCSSKIFTLHNVNPVEILVSSFQVSTGLPYTTVELVSIHHTNLSALSTPLPPPKPPYFVDVGHSASFRINITRPSSKGSFSGEILVHTSFNKVLHVPVYYKTIVGGVKVLPDFIDFRPTFPYGVSSVPLYVSNLYQQPVTVMSVRTEPSDARFEFHLSEGELPQLMPREQVQIGTAVFDPLHESAGESVYLGVTESSLWQDPSSSSSLPSATPTSASASSTKPAGSSVKVGGVKLSDPLHDIQQFLALWSNWTAVVEGGANVLNLSYVVKVDVGSELRVPGRATLVWPHLLDSQQCRGNLMEFPTTTIGSSHLQVLNVTNPSHHPLLIQPVLLQHYAKANSLVDMLTEQLDSDLGQLDFSTIHTDSFTFSHEHVSYDTDATLQNMVLQPSDQHQITVAFSPKVDSVASTLLLIRNNLTVFDYMVLRGRGVQGVFSIDGIQPSSDPLVFEFTQTMMEKCQAGSLREPMKLSRVFHMYNSGATPLTLYLAGIGAGGREEGGFAVHNYHREIIIKPNKTKSIEISFVPDFTISRVSNTLRFKTSTGTELLFPLLAILPHNHLATCYAMQPRPEWEQTIAWLSVPFWLCVLVTMIAAVLLQTNFGYTPVLSYDNDSSLPGKQATGGKVFDLNNIQSSRQEVENTNVSGKNHSKSPETLGPVSVPTAPLGPRQPPPPSLLPHEEPPHRSTSAPTRSTTKSAANVSSTSESRSKQVSEEQISSRAAEREKASVGSKGHSEKDIESYSGHEVLVSSVSKKSEKSSTPPRVDQVSPASSSSSSIPPQPAPVQKTEQPSPVPKVVPVAEIKPSPPIITQSTSNVALSGQHSRPPRPAEIDTKTASESHSTPPHFAAPDNTSPTTGVSSTPLPTKKVKRKSSSKSLKSSHPVPEPPQPVSSPSVSSPPPAVAVAAPVLAASQREILQRKESESSLKSTDSGESTGSSLEKSDEREDMESVIPPPTAKETEASTKVVETVLVKTKPQSLPLAKEPGTGQTVHMPEPASAEPPVTEEEGKKDSGGNKIKSKRKLRQLKKEEKSKKKEREKLSRAKEKAEKSRGMTDSSPVVSNEQAEDDTPDAVTPAVASKAKVPHSPLKQEQSKKQQKAKPVEAVEPSYMPDTAGVVSARKPPSIAENTGERDTSPPLPPPGITTKPTAPSVPSSAIKSPHAAAVATTKPLQEDLNSDPFSRNPDRSTYARKKISSKKSAEKAKSPSEDTASSKPELESEVVLGPSQEMKEGSDDSLDGDEADSSSVSPDGIEDSVEMDRQREQEIGGANISSPHDLAASVLSKMKRAKKARLDWPKGADSLEYDEEDLTAVKSDDFKMVNPEDISPMRDSSLSSPSPPLTSEQLKTSSLSLDAEPFYPSSNFKAKKHSKTSAQRHEGKKNSRAADRKISMDLKEMMMHDGRPGPYGAKPRGSGRTPTAAASEGSGPPPGIGHVDKAMLEKAEFFHQRPEKASTPSPPFPYGDPHAYRYSDLLYDSPEHLSEFRRQMERDPASHYGPGMDEAMLLSLSERMERDRSRHDPGRYPPPLSSAHHRAMYQQSHKYPHMGGYPQPPPGYPHDFRMQQYEDDFRRQQFLRKRKLILDLYRQERAALAAMYAREQARKSAEALNSLNRPTRMGMMPQEPGKHALTGSPVNVWEEYADTLPPAHPHHRGFEDPALVPGETESRLPFMGPDLPPSSQLPSRTRSLSDTSDIGGEILSASYTSPGVQSAASLGPPGYKLAPGAEYSRLEQQEDVGLSKESPLTWPPEGEDAPTGTEWDSTAAEDNWMLDPSLQSSSTKDTTTVSNTYALFENQSIWSLNNSGSESSNLLSWAMLGAAEQQQQQEKNTDQ